MSDDNKKTEWILDNAPYNTTREWLLDHIPYGWRMNRIYYDIKRSIKSWWQYRTKGYADEECWDLCRSTAEWILPRLKHMRDNLNGMPFNQEKEFNKDIPPDNQTLTMEEWKDRLDKMIYAFEFVVNEDDILEKCYPTDYDWGWTVNTEDKKFVFNDNRKPDYTYFDECEKRHKEGLALFCLYYRNLWGLKL